jgi:CBS domain-containing protein
MVKYRKSGKKRTIIIDRSRQRLGFQDVATERHDEVKKYFIELAENVTHVLNIVGMNFVPLK